MNEALSLSPAGLDFIAAREGFRAEVYIDAAGYPTIGFGHLLTEGEQFGSGIAREAALALLQRDAVHAEDAVRRHVVVDLSQCEFDALVSFTFNVGAANFAASTLLVRLNAGNFDAAADAFLTWDKIHARGAVMVSAGLAKRRAAERDLFRSGVYQTPSTPSA